jgi:hypothetical protein
MIRSAPLSWTLTLVFVGIAAFYGYRFMRAVGGGQPSRADRVSAGMHVVMSLGMIPMAWWWGMDLPVVPQLAVFGLGAVWFLALAVSCSGARGCAMHQRRGMRFYDVHHFVLMAAMVWMVAAMSLPLLASSSPAVAAPMGAGAAGEVSMAEHDHDLDMTAMDHAMDHSATIAAPVGTAPAGTGVHGVAVVSLLLALYFLLLIPWWVFELVGAGRTPAGLFRWASRDHDATARATRRVAGRDVAVEAAIHALKCGGMGVMLLAMI